MRAMILEYPGRPLVPRDVAAARRGPGQVRIKVHACAVCRTDLHVVDGELPEPKLPLVLGHQIVGTVDAAGDGAEIGVGERVGIPWLGWTDGDCRFCRSGRENLCLRGRFTGYHLDGGYAEAAVADARFCLALPEGYDASHAAPLLCAGLIGYRALRLAGDAERLGLYGFGSSAHITLQVARHWGCQVYVATREPARQRLALALGAAWAGPIGSAMPDKLDGAIVFAPAGEVVPAALRALDKGGTVALAGIHMTDLPAMAYEPYLFWEKTLQSVTANTREDGRALLAEAAAIPLRPRVTRYRLEDANAALADIKTSEVEATAVLTLD